MKASRKYWQRWADALRRYQLDEIAVSLLETGGPLTLLGAQALYVGRGFVNNDQLTALAETLEQDEEARAFAALLVASKNRAPEPTSEKAIP